VGGARERIGSRIRVQRGGAVNAEEDAEKTMQAGAVK
jgi:hypothetical protein